MKTKEELKEVIKKYFGESMLPWEEHYLDYHALRYLDTLAILGAGQGLRLLDVGAYPGQLTIAAHHLGYQVAGLSGRAESGPDLQMVVDRLGRHNITLSLVDVESEPFPFPNGSFDVVLASEIIEHLHFNPFRMLRESFRVLKSGGRILITTPNLNRLENLIRMIKGHTIHPDLSGRFDESFSPILSSRHGREYTASDLAYLLEFQNKEMYRFEKVQVHYSKCLEPSFSRPLLAGLADRFWPRFRSTLMVEAVRPSSIKLIFPEEVKAISGLYPVEEQVADMDGIARMLTTPFRWTEARAEFSLPAGKALYQIFYLDLAYLVPESLPPGWWTISVNNQVITHFSLPPDRMFTPVRFVLPVEMADQMGFPIVLSGPEWKPADHPIAHDYEFSTADSRNLGVVIGWDGFLREDCSTYADLLQAARREGFLLERYCSVDREVNWRKRHHCYDDRWSHLNLLYILQADFKSVLLMGGKDWRQLGPGWYFLEKWDEGPVRWTSRQAEAYLMAKRGAQHLRLRVFSGDSRLGTCLKGTLKVSYSQDRFSFFSLAEEPFDLPANHWTDLDVKFPQKISEPGLISLVIQTNQSRSPARLIPGSTDTRELGLVVRGIAVH